MTFFKTPPELSRQAIRWLVAYFLLLFLMIGAFFRLHINEHLSPGSPESQAFLNDLDFYLVLAFWLLVLGLLGFALLFVRVFFSPLTSLIEKSKSILKGDLRIKKSDVIRESRGEWYQLEINLNKIWRELKRKKAEALKERGELEAVMTAATDPILAVDMDLDIRYYNAPMALLFEEKEWEERDDESWGKKLSEVVRNQTIIEAFQAALQKGESQYVEARQEMSMDSVMHFFKVSVSPFMDEKKRKPRGAVAIFHDITDHKRLEKARMDFVANASHELKTPLAAIQGYLEHIKTSYSPSEEMETSFHVIEKNMKRLNSTISDLLQLSRIESAETISMEFINPLEATESVIHDLQASIKKKKQEFFFSYQVDQVKTNPDFLQHILINLVENAVKYSPSESQIKISWMKKGEFSLLSIKDNGPGIESFHQGRLFERFYRVRDEVNQNQKGTGLGLSIVRNAMQKMGGRVDVKSAPGLGSEFLCYFPHSSCEWRN